MHLSKDDGRLRADGLRADTSWTATGHERPVFLDERGRRRRWVLAGGALAGAAAGLWLAALVAGAIGFATLPTWQTQLRSDRAVRPAQVLRADRDLDPRRRVAEARVAEARVSVGSRSLAVLLHHRPLGVTS